MPFPRRFLACILLASFLLVLHTQKVSAASKQKTHFVGLRLRQVQVAGQSGLTVDKRRPDELAPSELIKPADCFRLRLVYFLDKNRRLGSIFDRKYPIVLATSTRQQATDSTVSDILVAFEKDFPSKSRLMDNINIYGPALATEVMPLHVELRISNVAVQEDQKSLFEQAVDITTNKIRETRAFSSLLNSIMARVANLYNNNVKVSVDLPWIAKDDANMVYSGYWAILPNEESADLRFLQGIRDGEYYLLDSGDVIDKTGKPVEAKRLPLFLLVRTEPLKFDPVNWRAEFGNFVQVINPNAPPDDVLAQYLRSAADAAVPKAEVYLFERLMKRRFDLIRTRPTPSDSKQAETEQQAKEQALNDFLVGFTSAGFQSEQVRNSFLKTVADWLTVEGGGIFPEGIRKDAFTLASILILRLAKRDIAIAPPRFQLRPVTSTGRRFQTIKMPRDGTSGELVHELVGSYLAFLDDGEVYLEQEWAQMRRTFLERFALDGAEESWPLQVFQVKLRSWHDSTILLLVANGKVRKLTGARAQLWDAEQVIAQLQPDRVISASEDRRVRDVIKGLAEFLVSAATDETERALVERRLREYTGYTGSDLPEGDWLTWLSGIGLGDLLYEAAESPRFFVRTGLRNSLIQTKQKHADYRKVHSGLTRVGAATGGAESVLGELILRFVRTETKNTPDDNATRRWLDLVTELLPALERRKERALRVWLSRAMYSPPPSDKWVPPADKRAIADVALESLRDDLKNGEVTSESLTWAARVFAVAGDSLPPEQRAEFGSKLANASDISEKEQFRTEDKTKPSFWQRFLKAFKFFGIADSPAGTKVSSIPIA